MIGYFGKVISGKHKGRELGFPTANVLLTPLHDSGVYVSFVWKNQKWYQSITHIGGSKTFDTQSSSLSETHILDDTEDLYGQIVAIILIEKIRDPIDFHDVNALINQIHRDISKARLIHQRLLV